MHIYIVVCVDTDLLSIVFHVLFVAVIDFFVSWDVQSLPVDRACDEVYLANSMRIMSIKKRIRYHCLCNVHWGDGKTLPEVPYLL